MTFKTTFMKKLADEVYETIEPHRNYRKEPH